MTKEDYKELRLRTQKIRTKILEVVTSDDYVENDDEYLRNLLIAQQTIAEALMRFIDITYDMEEE